MKDFFGFLRLQNKKLKMPFCAFAGVFFPGGCCDHSRCLDWGLINFLRQTKLHF